MKPDGCGTGSCIYDDSNGFTDCESWTYGADEIGESRPCWVYYDKGECLTCSCEYCFDGSRGSKPSSIPNEPTGWRSELCQIIEINKTECRSSILQTPGHWYQYTLKSNNCPDLECIYDDSDGQTDCESSVDYQIGDARDCWVYYHLDECQTCSGEYNEPDYIPINITDSPTLEPTANPTSED